MDKKSFRKSVQDEIAALSEAYIQMSNAGIYENFIAMPEFVNARNVFAYISDGREPETVRIIQKALDMGKRVALPISYNGGRMEPHVIASLAELVPGKFGIPAPGEDSPVMAEEEIDLIIVPAVTFNRQGFRLGRGGGYYDRFLERSDAVSVGLGRESLICEVPLEPHDMAVDCLVTESGVYK